MIRLVKLAFWVSVGAALALESEKWMNKLKVRLAPSSMTGSVLDRLNRKLEEKP